MNDAKRTKRLQALIESMNAGNDVARRDLKLALTTDEWNRYEASVQEQREFVAMLSDVPDLLQDYVLALKRADFLYARAEGMHPRGNAQSRTSLYHQADHAYERALERLSEILAKDPNLRMWLDRDHNDGISACSKMSPGVPRLLTSKSLNRGCDENSFWRWRDPSLSVDKRQLKLAALQSSLEDCLNPVQENQESRPNNPMDLLPNSKKRRNIGATDIDFT